MKIIAVYDQIQSGLGTKDDKMLPLGAMKEAVGPGIMMAPYLKQVDGYIVATLYCGNGFFMADPDETSRKLCAMVKRLQPDLVFCGPAFNFQEYAKMCGRVANDIAATVGIPVVAGMSEANVETIETYRDQVPIVKVPAKGEPGLKEALKNMCLLGQALAQGKDTEAIRKDCCY